jgi:hypothetical protein
MISDLVTSTWNSTSTTIVALPLAVQTQKVPLPSCVEPRPATGMRRFAPAKNAKSWFRPSTVFVGKREKTNLGFCDSNSGCAMIKNRPVMLGPSEKSPCGRGASTRRGALRAPTRRNYHDDLPKLPAAPTRPGDRLCSVSVRQVGARTCSLPEPPQPLRPGRSPFWCL